MHTPMQSDNNDSQHRSMLSAVRHAWNRWFHVSHDEVGSAQFDRGLHSAGLTHQTLSEEVFQRVIQQILEQSHDAIIIADAYGAVYYANASAIRFGLVVHGRVEHKDVLQAIQDMPQHMELRITSEGGLQLAAEVRGLDDVGVLRACSIVARDLSEQTRIIKAQQDFISNISHELKTPVGAIQLLAETLVDADGDGEIIQYFSERMYKESQRLQSLVTQIIDAARGEHSESTGIPSTTQADIPAAAHRSQTVVHGSQSAQRSTPAAAHRSQTGTSNTQIVAQANMHTSEESDITTDADEYRQSDSQQQSNSQHQQTDISYCNAYEVAQRAADDCEVVALTKGVRIAVVCKDPHTQSAAREAMQCNVKMDENDLRTVVRNLVQNAVQYSASQSTVTVVLECDAAATAAASEQSMIIRVVDRGIGISKQDVPRIFERFYRADPARSRNTGGSGLGLSIVKQLVHNAGGSIDVWSRPAEGTTFTLKLPIAPKAPIAPISQ